MIKLQSIKLADKRITAASSLLNLGDRLFTVCDDSYSLFEYKNETWVEHRWDGAPELPLEHFARKKLKPDFEALIEINSHTLMMMPSGSKPNRTIALSFDLNTHHFTAIDLQDFFHKLQIKIPLINIEGGVLQQNKILLLNRGVRENPSHLIEVEKDFSLNSISEINFGQLHGSELCFFDNKLYALAVAEDCDNSFDDGEILGSLFCQIDLESKLVTSQTLFDKKIKTEGLCRFENQWLVVTDPDGTGQSEFFTFCD